MASSVRLGTALGVVLAVRGVHEPGGDFVVSATSYAGLPPNPHPLPGWGPLLVPQQRSQAGMATAAPGDKYVALASGFCLGSSKADMLKVRSQRPYVQVDSS